MSAAANQPDDPLAGLNPAQRAAVMHGVAPGDAAPAGPLLVIAGAGSGKTMTLAHRVAHLIASGADARRILLITFSRRAAQEMERRAERILTRRGVSATSISWAGTFHAIGARLLRMHAAEIGLDPAFTIHDRSDSADLMAMVRHDLALSSREKRFPLKGTCLQIYSLAVNAQAPLPELLARRFPWCVEWTDELKRLFAAYVEAKQAQNVLDYDDLLLWWAETMAQPEIAARIAERFDHVLVDEYQDTNRLQGAILTRLKPDGRGLAVVGDDAQSIYSFRAAEVRNILDFPGLFSPPARIVTLEANYRSTQPILAASNAVIALARERFAKTLTSDRPSASKPRLVSVRDETDQAAYVATRILEAREAGLPLKSQAALFRAAHHSAALELELTRRNIPFVKFGGLRFLEAAHVKDLLAMLRFVENPGDRVAGFRLLQLLPGIGPGAAGKFLDRIADAPDRLAALAAAKPPAQAAADWPAFVATLTDCAAARWPAEVERARLWLEPQVERLYDDAAARKADLLQLERLAQAFAGRAAFLTDLTLDPPGATSAEAGPPLRDEDYVILSTIHSAKGQEWRSVFLVNAVDGCLPSDLATGSADEIEEERRLLYVAMTRAKDELDIVTPQRFFTTGQPRGGDRHVYAARTRFIPAAILKHFEQTVWPAAARPGDGRAPAVAPVDLRAKMRGMWG
ncbi:MAG: ATP-dependent helicase [Methylobacteriaceae bacterium]|nr:ATP-dependent helicase [Methylobacteriaceae bacterium]